MQNAWLLSKSVTRILWVSAVSVFLVTEAMVVVASLGWPKGNPSLGAGHVLLNVFLLAIPGLASFRGYSAVKRLRSNFEAEPPQEITFVWLSRQFLVVTIFSYVAIIIIVISLTRILHIK
jgi:hypothetical protein